MASPSAWSKCEHESGSAFVVVNGSLFIRGFVMKSISSRVMAVVALTMSLGFAAGSANAITAITPWSGTASTGQNAAFFNTAVTNPFTNWYSFTIPAGSDGNGGANVISLGATNVIFSLFQLYDSVSSTTWSGITGGTTSSLSFSGGAAPGSYTLTVSGYKVTPALAGSYAGNISISPVPEPETYAMLLAGLGLLGLSARRRNSSI